ncbi:MAG TPA: TolC family protein [Blastocatellia bacterium]|nr:TolC family protein [Blastocatellia bacterium]
MTTKSYAALSRLMNLTVAMCCALIMSATALAQDQAQTPPTQQPEARPIPQRTVGLDAGKVVRWTLRDAILAALEKNVDIELERENTRLAQFDLFAAQGVYDRNTTAAVSYGGFTQANTRLFSGTSATTTAQQTLTYNAGVSQLLEKGGGNYLINFNNTRQTNNFGTLSPQYNPSLNFTFTQPLFRGYKIDASRRQIKIAKKTLDLNDATFRQRAIEIISRVQQAYWDLAFAIKDEEIQRDSVKLAETQLNNNKRQVEVGTLAPIEVIQSATTLESRRQQVFVAMNTVSQAENALKALTVDSPGDELWGTQIIPVESFDIKPISIPLGDALKLAVDNRPELRQFALQKDINQINVDFFRNQAKPQIDFVASYNMIGVAGQRNAENPLALTVPACVDGQPPPATGCLPANLLGSYPKAVGNLFKNDFRNWSVGVNIQIPWRNTVAKANLGRAIETTKQIDLQTRRMSQSIEVEVRNAVQSLETAKMRIEASRAARIYAEQQLEGEEKKFAAGLSVTFFVLQRQTDLSVARGSELRALADYNKAVAELQRVVSTTLTSNSVEIKPTPQASIR